MSTDTWRRCSSCKTDIPFGKTYWVCNVSTCNRARIGLFFCSVSCWEAHLPMMRHRESWAVEKTAPSKDQWEREQAAASEAGDDEQTMSAPAGEQRERRVVAAERPSDDAGSDDLPHDILIVASKLKKYVKARSGMRTSDSCIEALSTIVRDACNEAIRRAGADGRQTVMDRDFRRY